MVFQIVSIIAEWLSLVEMNLVRFNDRHIYLPSQQHRILLMLAYLVGLVNDCVGDFSYKVAWRATGCRSGPVWSGTLVITQPNNDTITDISDGNTFHWCFII